MDAKLEKIGARCATCHRQDFLPFKCPHCKGDYCLDHARADLHRCAVAAASAEVARSPSPATAVKGKTLKELQAKHLARRGPVVNEHAAAKQARASSAQSAKARSLLATFKKTVADATASVRSSGGSLLSVTTTGSGSTNSSSVSTQTGSSRPSARSSSGRNTKPPTGAELRQIAQWKREAHGDAVVQADRRLYVRVSYIDRSGALLATTTTTTDTTSTARTVWLDRDWVIGRCLDSISRHLNVANRNATSATTDSPDRLHLVRKLDGTALEPSQRFAQVCPQATAPSARLEELILYRGRLPFVQ